MSPNNKMETIPWDTGNKIESHLGITRLNTMQTLIMLCLKDNDSIWEVRVTEQKAQEQYCWHMPLSFFPYSSDLNHVITGINWENI